MAHALLGAIEAKAIGNNALVGATAGVVGETTAQLITERLYNKQPKDLTEQEKNTVTALSQIASGLSAGLVGDSSQAGLAGMEIGKRAVENNFLGPKSDKRYYELKQKIDRGEILTSKEEKEFVAYSQQDHNSDYLLDKFKSGQELTISERKELGIHLANYMTELAQSGESSLEINRLVNALLTEKGYFRSYSYPFALTNERKRTLLSDWNRDKSEYEKVYENINYNMTDVYKSSYQGKLDRSNLDSIELVFAGYGAFALEKEALNMLVKANSITSNSTKITLGVSGVASVISQYADKGYVSPEVLGIDLGSAYLGQRYKLTGNLFINSGAESIKNYLEDKNVLNGAIAGAIGSGVGYGISKTIDFTYYKIINKNTIYDEFVPNYRIPYLFSERSESSPYILMRESGSNTASNYINDWSKNKLEKLQKEHKDEK